MSYKLNQQDPTRRDKLLARRDTSGLPHVPHDQIKSAPTGRNMGSLMKISRRNAAARFLRRKVLNSRMTAKQVELAEELMAPVLRSIHMGTATRKEIYG